MRRLPVDVVKLDRSFVVDVEHDARSRAIVRGIVQLAAAIGCTTVAEGVETAGQLEALTELGCDAAQGYWLARPAPPTTPFPQHGAAALAGQSTRSSSSPR